MVTKNNTEKAYQSCCIHGYYNGLFPVACKELIKQQEQQFTYESLCQ